LPASPRRSALLFLIAGLLFASTARADVKSVRVGEVRCSVQYEWPELLTFGSFPVEVTLWNEGSEDLVVALEAVAQWWGADRVTRKVALRAGETAQLELLLRADAGTSSEYRLNLDVRGASGSVPEVGPDSSGHGDERTVLYLASTQHEAGSTERWAQKWTAHAAGAGRSGEVHVGAARLTDMPRSWEAYSSLDLVVLDLAGGEPESDALDALLAWVRCGGRLLVSGEDARGLLTRSPAAAGWLEDRFEVKGGAPCDLRVYRFAHGLLVLDEVPELGASPMEVSRRSQATGVIAHDLDLSKSWTRWRDGGSRMSGALSLLGGFGRLPLRGYIVFLVLFAVLIGPVNFLWVRRQRKPMLLLVTVPGIALCVSIGLVLYGILAEGLDVKANTRSWSVLDQRVSQATTAEARRLFAGSSPGAGLRPERGTAVFPEPVERWQSRQQMIRFRQDLTDGRLLTDGFVQVRQPFSQLVLGDRAARSRLEARHAGEGVEVSNALGATVDSLLLRSPDGEYHLLEGELAPGASAHLRPTSGISASLPWNADLKRILGEKVAHLPPATYLASIHPSVLGDDCGVEVREIDGRHVVLGVLDASEETWR